MSKKVDVSFMKNVSTDAECKKEVLEGGSKVLCSAWHAAARDRVVRARTLPCAHNLLVRARAPPAVVDCFTATWGPCEMVAAHFSNFFFDLGETLGLKFVRAQSNNIGDLKEFANSSESNFLFYLVRGGGASTRALPAHRVPLT